MRIVMTLVLRDEADILEDNLDYHMSQGVDFFIATDHASTDATPGILERYARRGLLEWTREEGERFRQGHWTRRMARSASDEHDADWVIHNDADEFWWPREGDLKQALARVPHDAGTLAAPRFNYMPPSEGGPFWRCMTVRDEHSVNFIGRALPPKVCHRGTSDVVISSGMHAVFSESLGRASDVLPVEILHFPHRSFAHFEQVLTKHHSSRKGRQVPFTPRLHMVRLMQAGLHREYFDRHQIHADDVHRGTADPRYRVDTRFRDHMAALRRDDAGTPG